MNQAFDLIVVGLGAMGSAALYHLSKRGLKVLGIDRYLPPHAFGSSHGETRVIREAYFEDPIYVPIVQRAYALWEQLEKESGTQLYLKTGGIMIGPPGSTVAEGAIRSAKEHALPHEVLTAKEISSRFPGLHPGERMIGVMEPRAGILYPEKCIEAHLKLARRHGAEIMCETEMLSWAAEKNEVTLTTAAGRYTGSQLIVAAGAWLSELIQNLEIPLQVERQVLLWFKATDPELYSVGRFPIHLWEYEPGKMFYGFPDLGSGVKVAFHHQGEMVTPREVDREVQESDVTRMRVLLQQFLPGVSDELLRGTVCLYTNTPDGHFIIDRHPSHPNVIVASPCSGHGFKFASAIGELLALMVLGQPKLNLRLFSFQRFQSALP